MKTLLVIKDKDIGSDSPDLAEYRERTAARAVVFDVERNVALLHATVNHYHKLPGGGVEPGEDLMAALEREAEEEIGCDIENIRELGAVEEFRNQIALHQWSYCFTATQVGEKGIPKLEPDEEAEGFVTVWVPLSEAIQILESELESEVYLARFMTRRDLAFLKAAESATL